MGNFNKPKILLISLLTCTAFNANAALWDFWKSAGDDGKVNTVGNAAAAKNALGLTFMIENQSNSTINSVNILDKNGKLVYNNTFSCGLDQKCNLVIKNVTLTADLTMKFYDAKKQLVSAYLMSNKPMALNSMILDDKWLGLYAFNQMVKVTKKKPQELNTQLIKFFNGYSSPDGTLDIFEELGLYFVAQQGGVNENTFYASLNKRLANNQPLLVNKSAKKKKSLGAPVRSTQSDSPSGVCDPAVQSTFSYINQISGFIPVVGDGVAAIFGIGEQIMSDACPSGDAWISNKFDEIDNKLKQFDQELKSLNYRISELYKYVDSNITENSVLQMDSDYSQLVSNYFNVYTSLASGSSLVSYVAKTNGLKKSMANSPQLQSLLSKIPVQLNSFDKLLSNAQLTKMKASLDNVCKNANTTSGDIIAERTKCNIATTRVLFTIDSSALRLKPMVIDEINVIAAAIKSGNVDAAWLQANVGQKFTYDGQSYDWDKAADAAAKAIDTKVKFINETFVGASGEKLYKPLEGLSPTLQTSMINAQCASGNLPAIKAWHTSDDTGKNPYVITECGDGSGGTIISKYYYDKRGTTEVDDKVVNAMGVLVPDRFFHGDNNNNYGSGSAFPWASTSEISTLVTTTDQGSSAKKTAYFNIPSGNPKAYSMGFRVPPTDIKQVMLAPNKFEGSDVTLFKEETPGRFVTIYHNNMNWDSFSILRYTKGDYAYVWVMRTWSHHDHDDWNLVGDHYYKLLGAPQCLTNDCSIVNTGETLDKINFIDGTTIQWTRDSSDTHGMATYTIK